MVSGSTASGSLAGSTGVDGRQTFAAEELAVVLSRYDLGWLDAVQPYPHGSRKAPKLLLRRRGDPEPTEVRDDIDDTRHVEATGPDSIINVPPDPSTPPPPEKEHEQIWLLKRRGPQPGWRFPCRLLPRGTASPVRPPLPGRAAGSQPRKRHHHCAGQSTLRTVRVHQRQDLRPFTGNPPDTPGACSRSFTSSCGITTTLRRRSIPPSNGYHRAEAVARAFKALPSTLYTAYPDLDRVAVGTRNQFLQSASARAADTADAAGLPDWPTQVVHADWHPGNLIFGGQQVSAVIDFDAARVQPRIMDVANGALQFSIDGGGEDLSVWPDAPDEGRFKPLCQGLRRRARSRAQPGRTQDPALPHD